MSAGLTRMTTYVEEHVLIPGDGMNLDGRLAYSENLRPACTVLIAGAHPLLGGNMSNNVVSAIRAGLAALGAVSLSFEYRQPADASPAAWAAMLTEFWQSHHVKHEAQWRDDACSAARFLKRICAAPMVLVGYSFGCWAIGESAAAPGSAALVFVSPNPVDHDLGAIDTASAPLLVIASDNDFCCALSQLHIWLDSLHGSFVFRTMSGAAHFFRGRESELVDLIADFLRNAGLIET